MDHTLFQFAMLAITLADKAADFIEAGKNDLTPEQRQQIKDRRKSAMDKLNSL